MLSNTELQESKLNDKLPNFVNLELLSILFALLMEISSKCTPNYKCYTDPSFLPLLF